MTIFLLCAVLLLALAVSFLVWPLLRGGTRAAGRDRAIVSLYRDQLRELSADHAAGTLNAEQFESGRRELERRLLEDIGQPSATPGVSRPARLTAVGLGAFVLVVPIGLYLALGTPAAISPLTADSQAAGEQQAADDGKAAPHAITAEQVQVMIDQLAKRLEQSPRDGEGWAMLARSYSYVRKFPEAVKAYEKAAQLLPNDAHLFADYADALAMTQDRRLTGPPMKLIQRALAIDPKDVKALALAGSEAFDRKDYPAAIGFWQRAVKAGPPEPQFTQQLQAGIAEARKLAGAAAPPPIAEETAPPPAMASAAREPEAAPTTAASSTGATVKGRVELAAALAAKAAPTDTLFVFARAAQGPRMPLALLKRQVKDLPLEFALDDSMAMMPSLKLSNFSSVVVGARVSKAGDAMPASGDLQGFSAPVKVGSAGVDVRIDQVVP
ncbi:MAG TPA: c-type cytochrome biogenesis protein CcmI [Burkholderiaceae bacterium]|nr:c-type cytochrome biogenesis protein CcmI [Burkholderiaceae bacterium]